MTKAKKLTIGLLASVVFACALFCTANFAFADENPLQKIKDTLNSLYAGNDIVAQDVYGIYADQYATTQTKVTFTGGEDAAVDVVKTDGTVLFQTSTADTQIQGDPVWQKYKFKDSSSTDGREYGFVGNDLNDYGYASVLDKTTQKYGLINKDGQFVLPASFDSVPYPYYAKTGLLLWGVNVDEGQTQDVYTFYKKDTLQQFATATTTHQQYVSSPSFIGKKYMRIGTTTADYYKISDNQMEKLDNIKGINSVNNDYYVIQYQNGDVCLEKPNGESVVLLNDPSSQYAMSVSVKGEFIVYGYGTSARIFNYSGTEVTSKFPSGCTLIGSFNDGQYNYTTGQNSTSNRVYFFNSDGDTVKQLTGQFVGSYDMDPYFCIYNVSGSTITVDLYNGSFVRLKTMKQVDIPSGKTLQSVDWFPRNTQAFSGSRLGFEWTDYEDSLYYWFDASFNEVPESDFAMYQLKTGTKIYQQSSTQGFTTKYTDFQGNDIYVGGYKLAVYYDGTVSYYEPNLRHGEEDIWWAQDPNTGKYGAIDSYGNIVVGFQYDKFRDINVGCDEALGYKNGKWETISFGAIPKPQPVVDSVTEDSITLSWPAITGAEKYAVATKNDDGSFKTYTLDLTNTTYTITGLTEGKTYKCLVQAYANGKWSTFTDEDLVPATTKSNHPKPVLVDKGDGYANIKWDAIPGATKYAIAEMENGTYRNYTIEWTGTTYKCDNLANGYGHNILVQAFVNGKWTNFTKDDYLLVEIDGETVKPTTELDSTTDHSVTLKWNHVPGAKGYAAAVRDRNGQFKTVFVDPDKRSAEIDGLIDSEPYDGLVQANIYGVWSSFTEEDFVEATTKGNRPAPQEVETGDGYADIEWDAIPGATAYAIATIENGTYKNYSTTCTDTSYHCDNLANGYSHYILVQAYVDGKWSPFTKDNYLLVDIQGETKKPTTTVSGTTDASVTITWNQVPGASEYAAAVRDKDGKYKSVYLSVKEGQPYPSTATIDGLNDGAEYKAIVQSKIFGEWSTFTEEEMVVVTTASYRPQPTQTGIGDGYADISWPAIQGATAYAIAEIENGSYRNYTTEWTGTTYHCDNLANGYDHYILVQAYVNGKWTNFDKSNYLTVHPTGATKPTTTVEGVTENSVTLKWAKVAGATEYAAAVRDASGKYISVYTGADATTATISGLTPNTSYRCIVQCKIYGAWSTFTEADMADATTSRVVNIPTAKAGLKYTGSEQVGVPAGAGYTITGNTATTAGSYTATAQLKSGYIWNDGTTEDKDIGWSIGKAAGSIILSSTSKTVVVNSTSTVTATITTDGTINCKSSDTGVATVKYENETITIKGISVGTCNMTLSSSETTNYSAASATLGVKVISDAERTEYTSSTSRVNAILCNATTSAYDCIKVEKTGDGSSEDDDFYGYNAAILAKAGGLLTINDAIITTAAKYANAVFSYGTGTTVDISDSTINTTANNSGGVMVTGGGTLTATDVNATTSGDSSAPIRSDKGGGTLTTNRGTYISKGIGSPAIYSTAAIKCIGSNLTSEHSEGVIVEGRNSVNLNNCTLIDTNDKLNGKSTTYKNVFLYQSQSGDAEVGTAKFTATDSNITTNKGDSFYVTNNTAQIDLNNNTITNNDATGYLLRAKADAWGKTGKNGGSVTFNLTNQKVSGNIYIDNISTLAMTMKSGSKYTGTINGANTAKTLSLNLSADSNIVLTGDSYLTSFTDADTSYSNVDTTNGHLYVNGVKIK